MAKKSDKDKKERPLIDIDSHVAKRQEDAAAKAPPEQKELLQRIEALEKRVAALEEAKAAKK